LFAFGASDADVNWYIDFSGVPAFHKGVPDRYDVRLQMSKSDWLLSLQGKLSATQAMLRRKIKIDGSMTAIMSLSMDALLRTYKEQMG
ncbi:MAG: sterol transfer family, partial [Actinomycetota bacterium]|nr:sterol transfer family [Actinomycetota bacterium]